MGTVGTLNILRYLILKQTIGVARIKICLLYNWYTIPEPLFEPSMGKKHWALDICFGEPLLICFYFMFSFCVKLRAAPPFRLKQMHVLTDWRVSVASNCTKKVLCVVYSSTTVPTHPEAMTRLRT